MQVGAKTTFPSDAASHLCTARTAHPHSMLVQGPADHTLAQIKEAIRDGLRAVKNTLDDGAVVPGAGAFEIAAAHHLRTVTKKARTCIVFLCGGLWKYACFDPRGGRL